MNAPELIELDRILLRRPRLSDAEVLFECGNDPDVARYMDWPLGTSLERTIERIGQREESWRSGDEFYWVISLLAEDRPIGAISCRIENESAEFGFFLSRRYWGYGYGTAAARAIVDWAISVPTISRVWATCDSENVASSRVLEKSGLSREGALQGGIVRPNLGPEPRDAFVYSRVR